MASRAPVIVIPTDFSDASATALDEGLELAEQIGARVELVYVASKLKPLFPRSRRNREAVAKLQREEVAEAKAALDQLAAKTRLPLHVRVLKGTPDTEIIAHAKRKGARYIVMGTQGHSLAGTLFLGSTTERVLRESEIPVLVVPARMAGARKLPARRQAIRRG